MTHKIVTKNTLRGVVIVIFMLPLALAACRKSSKATPTSSGLSPDTVKTVAAQTAEARRSQTGSQTPTSPPEPTFDTTSIAVTQAAATQQAQITPSPVVTATVASTTVAPTSPAITPTGPLPPPVGVDNAVFTGKETIPDGTNFAPGAKFTKSWQFMNTGQTTWTTAYSLVFLNGEHMGGPVSVPVKIEVQSGRIVEISVDLTAPTKTGSYKGNWRMRNPAGQFFGDIVYVQIVVAEGGGTSPTQPATGKVSRVTLSVDKTTFTGKCPHVFTFVAEVKVNAEAAVTFKLEFGGGITAPATAQETTTISAGTVELSFTPEFKSSGSGWARLHITAPNEISSNQVDFTLTCQP
jgi:hypothetical protein